MHRKNGIIEWLKFFLPNRPKTLRSALHACFFMALPGIVLCFLAILAGIGGLYFLATASYYRAGEVLKICNDLNLEATDEFCAEPDRQDAYDFARMMERRFPVYKTTYETINAFMPLVYHEPTECNISEAFSPGFCPPPDICASNKSSARSRYTCSVVFPNTRAEVRIGFNKESGQVEFYSAQGVGTSG